jgi:hypothetical protein
MTLLIGAGGGGGGKGGAPAQQYVPSEEPDSLDSTQYATIIDLISEGEIEGLVDGHKSIYLEDTQFQNKDGTYNFKNAEIATRNGTQSQEAVPFAPDAQNTVPVGVTVRKDSPVTRTITDRTVDAVRVTISVPALQYFSDKGDVGGASVRLQILTQYNGAGFNIKVDNTISGRTADLYQRDYLIELSGDFPVEIRVVRVTADSTSSRLTNDFAWSSYTEVTRARLRYPNSALIAWRIDAQQFSNIPSRAYHIRGIKIHIPANATVEAATGRLIYSGLWNGTFAAKQWTNDPAWCLWDLLTSRYGFGSQILTPAEKASFNGNTSRLDKFAFYTASQYCAELVDDGYGGKEPRFSCNVNIQTPEEAYTLINNMASVFRAMPFWGAGSITIGQDAPSNPVYLFSNANVVDGIFDYSSSGLKNRPTVVLVSWFDIKTRDIAYESVEDQERVALYGAVTREMDGFACTSRGQARRVGEWILYSEWNEGEIVSFSVGIEAGVIVRPGHIIAISDTLRSVNRRSGRIKAATSTIVTVDNANGLTYAAGAMLSVILPNGVAEQQPVSGIAAGAITVSSPFSAVPNANSIWIYETPDLQPSTWRVLGTKEEDGVKYAISAISYDASKYAHVEQGLNLEPRNTSPLTVIPDPPAKISAEEVLYESNGRASSKIIVRWQPVVGIGEYRVLWRYEDGNWSSISTPGPDYEILNSQSGSYSIKVFSVNKANLRSSTAAAEIPLFEAQGKTAAPETPAGISLIPIDQASAILSWTRATDLDVLLGGKVLIRHSPAMTGALWQDSQEIVAAAAGSQTQKQVPLLSGTYLIKFEDDTGHRSVDAASAVTTLPTPQPRLLVQSYREDQEATPFPGVGTDMIYSVEYDALILALGVLIDDLATDGDFDALTSIDGESFAGSGSYQFASTPDMGGVYDVNMRRYLATRALLMNELIDSMVSDIDSWSDVFGATAQPDYVSATLYVRSTNDDPSGTPTWSDWVEFANATKRGRAFQFKTEATTLSADQNILIDELGCEIELEQRVATAGPLTSGAASYGVAFAEPFYAVPAIGVTAYNMGTGDYYSITAMSRSGFTITFYNASATVVSRNFTYSAVGFGREIV